VQRCFALLPAFLTLARDHGAPALDLVELGPAAGLNLLWDRYAYRYRAGRWGSSELLLHGVEYEPVPLEVLARRVEVRRRLGIDLNPVDVTTVEGARLLRAFIWPGRVERAQRLRQAIGILWAEPPTLVRGDYVELLPSVLAERDDEAIGWALRQHARTDPAWVRAFVAVHGDQLSGLSRREALKHLSPA